MVDQTSKLLLVILSCLALCQGAILPSYLSKCSLSDPNLTKCMTAAGNNAIKTLTKGDRKYKISPMNPLNVPLIDLSTGGLNLKLTDAKLSHLDDLAIESLSYDDATGNVEFRAKIPSVGIESRYEVNGQILILPVKGEGPSKITLDKGTYTYTGNLKTIQKNGKEYLNPEGSDCKIELGGATFDFQNLFNGDKRLGGELNKFINENWSDVMNEFYPAIKLVIRSIVDNTLKGYFGTVPKADVFDP